MWCCRSITLCLGSMSICSSVCDLMSNACAWFPMPRVLSNTASFVVLHCPACGPTLPRVWSTLPRLWLTLPCVGCNAPSLLGITQILCQGCLLVCQPACLPASNLQCYDQHALLSFSHCNALLMVVLLLL